MFLGWVIYDQVAPDLQVLLQKRAQHTADSNAVDEITQFLATCYGSAGCGDARARVEGLKGCQMYVQRCVKNLLCICAIAVMPIQTQVRTQQTTFRISVQKR